MTTAQPVDAHGEGIMLHDPFTRFRAYKVHRAAHLTLGHRPWCAAVHVSLSGQRVVDRLIADLAVVDYHVTLGIVLGELQDSASLDEVTAHTKAHCVVADAVATGGDDRRTRFQPRLRLPI